MIPKEKSLNLIIKYAESELLSLFDLPELNSTIAILVEHFLRMTKIDVVLNQDKMISNEDELKIIEAIEQLKTRKPLAYVLGEWEFYNLRLKVDENTLIPRPETEELVQLIIEGNKNRGLINILDIGTGSGCIALALKANLTDSKVEAWDVSEQALVKVRENAEINSLGLEIRKNDILSNPIVLNKWDIIVSNPPYILNKEKTLMKANVLDFEPHLALFVYDDEPLIFYIAIADFAKENLKKDGELYFEINENFGNEVKEMLQSKGFENVQLIKDINDKNRMIRCYRS